MSESDARYIFIESPSPRKRGRKPYFKWSPGPALEIDLSPSAVPTVPAPVTKKRRARSPWHPNSRQDSILSISQKLSLREYSIKMDELEPFPDKWKEKGGPKTHKEMWELKEPWRGRLRDERRATWKAYRSHRPQPAA